MLINIPTKINDLLPAAIYKAVVTGTELKKSTGDEPKDYTSIELTIQSQGPDENVKTIGRKTFDMLTWTDKALSVSNKKVKQITGREITEIIEPGQISVEELHMAISNAMLNKSVLVQLTVEPVKRDGVVAEGEFRNNVKKYQRTEG